MRLMSLSEVMDKAIEALRKNIKTIALFSLGYGIIAFIGIAVISIVGAIIGAITAVISSSVVLSVIIISILILFIIAFIFSYYIGIIKITSQEFTEESIFAHTAIKASFKSIFKVYIIMLIGGIISLPMIAVFGGIGYFLFRSFDVSNINYGLFKGKEITFVVLSFLYVIGVAFASTALFTWFSFSLQVLVIEKEKVFKCIKRSFYLVRKEYWNIFGATVLFNLTVVALRLSIDILISTGSSLIFLLLKVLNFKQDYFAFISMIYSYANWPLNIVLMMVITPIASIMLTILYFNQRFKKEGFDLEIRLRHIQIKEERKQISEAAQFNGSH